MPTVESATAVYWPPDRAPADLATSYFARSLLSQVEHFYFRSGSYRPNIALCFQAAGAILASTPEAESLARRALSDAWVALQPGIARYSTARDYLEGLDAMPGPASMIFARARLALKKGRYS
jgi:hypothetical protein